MAESEYGRIHIFDDFFGCEAPVAETGVPRRVGAFMLVGQGIAENDSGAPALDSDGLSGVIQLTTTNEDNHTAGLQTASAFDVALMAPIVMEARVRFTDLDTKEAFVGFTDINISSDVPSIETDLGHGATTTLTLTASDICGFLLSSELTDDEDWHAIYNGGTTTGETTSTNNDLNADAVAGEWQVLRLEIDPDGRARWYVDGDLKLTVSAAVSTTVDLKFFIAVEAKGNAIETMDVDYIGIRANRDWTV